MELKEAILTRRSIRKFTDYKVTDKEILELLESARFAPSWSNTQTWEFIIIKEKKLIKEITEAYSITNPARPCSYECSLIIVGVSKLGVSGCRNGEQRTIHHEWYMCDMGIAIQNISLRAHDMGFGSVIVGSMDHKKIKEILKVPEGFEVICALPIGKPDEVKSVPKRKNMKDFIYLNIFGNDYEIND